MSEHRTRVGNTVGISNRIKSGIGSGIRYRIIAVLAVLIGMIWILRTAWSGGFSLPRWVEWSNKTFTDASGQYEVILKRRTVKVNYDNSVIWTAQDKIDGIKVQDAMFCDIDGDGADELILLCWKVGRFGNSKPFWVEEDEKSWSQHIFVYSCNGDKIKPKWMSSYIGVDVAEMSARGGDILSADDRGVQSAYDRDGLSASGKDVQLTDTAAQAIVTGRQHLLLTDADGRMSSWIWDSWGFTKEDTDISFVVFGDILIHEPIYQYGLHKTGDNNGSRDNSTGSNVFDFLFQNKDIKREIAESDVAVINQETPLTDQPARYSDYPRFGTPAGVGEAVVHVGFDAVTCATNHALDQGPDGIGFTKEYFDSRDVLCLGIQSEDEKDYRPYEILIRKGVKFALLNYTYGTNGAVLPNERPYMVHLLNNEEQVRADLKTAGDEADFVLVFVHWGTEGSEETDEFQQKWVRIFLESQVDAVVGTHPHTLQPYEILQADSGHKMLVYYSIGNYISAQQEQSCVKGGMARFTVSLTPDGYQISDYGLQQLMITRQADGKYTVGFAAD